MKKKILVIITTGYVPWGGLTTVAMNYYRAMEKHDFQIDFVSYNDAALSLINELSENGDRYFQLPDRKKKTIIYVIKLYELIKKQNYDIVHIHGNSATMVFELLPAFFARVKKRIVHVHNTMNQHFYLDKLLRPLFYASLTKMIAVSKEAGEYMYGGRDYIILNNAIDIEHYKYNERLRNKCRERYGIDKNAFVIGTVGKINKQKNQKFLVEVFSNISKEIENVYLMIVGGGELEGELLKQIHELSLEKKCILTGMQEDVTAFLSGMDCFVLPSLYEGLPLAAIEAQASGLPTIVSSNVSKQTGCTNLYKQVALEKGVEGWSEEIKKSLNLKLDREKKWIQQLVENGFDIKTECKKLETLYKTV